MGRRKEEQEKQQAECYLLKKINDCLHYFFVQTCVQVGTQLIRGISGGERKRTNIGMELIIDPSVLFLDEPTTGLDASTANSVLLLLKRCVSLTHSLAHTNTHTTVHICLLCSGWRTMAAPSSCPSISLDTPSTNCSTV